MEQGYLISKSSYTGLKSFIYIESRDFNFDIEMIKEYLTNYSSALDNYLMNQELIKDQKRTHRPLSENHRYTLHRHRSPRCSSR